MYTNLTIQKLRGIKSLVVDDLRRVNLIVGRNNTGKTTLLEAISLLGGATNSLFPVMLSQMRGQRLVGNDVDPLCRSLFYNLNPRVPIVIRGRWTGEDADRSLQIEAIDVSRGVEPMDASDGGIGVVAVTQEFLIGGLRLRYTSARGGEVVTSSNFPPSGTIQAGTRERDDFVRTTLLSARAYPSLARDAQQFSVLLRNKQERDVLEALQIIEPGIERIEVLSEPAGPAVYVDIGLESLVPLAVCGEGFVRLFSIAVELTTSRGGVLLIDEIDNGLHHSVMAPVWEWLARLCERQRVQIFATTHNEELLHSALETFSTRHDQLGLFRIDRRDEQHKATAYDAETQEVVRTVPFEVRG